MNVILSDETVFRIQNLINKPISRGFDKSLQCILDDYEKLKNPVGCKVQPTEVEDTVCDTAT